MKIKFTYPDYREVSRKAVQRSDIISAAKWPFLLCAYICPILNICLGGKAWSVIVLWSLWIAWSWFISPAMVEYNRISQPLKLIIRTCILLILTDTLLAPGWAIEVVPIVCFSGLILSGVLFFTDFNKQKHNMLPMLTISVLSVISSIAVLVIFRPENPWALVVMGALALALLIACFIALGSEFLREFQKRFHTK